MSRSRPSALLQDQSRDTDMDELLVVTTGGTIDKVYFDDKSDYQIGEPQIGRLLEDLGVAFRFQMIPILRKASLHTTAEHRDLLRAPIAAQPARRALVPHGPATVGTDERRLGQECDRTGKTK